MRARLSEDGARVRMEGALWSMSFPIEGLGAWLAFYRGLAARRVPRSGGDYAAHYGDTVAELERVAAEVSAARKGLAA